MNKLGTKLGAIAMSAAMALTFAPSTMFTLAAETDDALISTETVPVYRFYNPNSGEHVWTTSEDEGTLLSLAGWEAQDLGDGTNIAWYAPTTGDQVYRLYNPNVFDAAGNQIGDHVYTTSSDEANGLVAAGWSLDESNFYSALATDSKADGIYRAYNPNAYALGQSGAHHFTMSETEYSGLGAIGWTLEGVRLLGYSEDIDQELAVELSSTTPKVGDTLTAIVTGADVVTYSWTADGEVVGTEEDLDITPDMLGKKIQVKVTALDGETVKSEESAPVVYETPDIVTAERKAANSFTLTFDSPADEIVKADDIEVISEDETDVKKITGLDFSLDGLTAVVTVSTSFKDGVTYNVNYDDSTASFVASVGEVDKIVIATSQAEVNTATPIEFALYDANGVDVTSAVKVDETCTVSFTGDYDNYNDKKASASTVTMATAGDICTVTVEYNKNDGVTDPVTASKDITCVAASEKMGVPFFKYDVPKGKKGNESDVLNDTDDCYRFYDPAMTTDTNIKVALDDETLVHFYAQDADKSAISYDSYEIESADETVATATMGDVATGKWASFTVAGNSKGNVMLTLTATKNGAETTYEIPVTVTEKDVPVKATLAVSKSTMSNAWDNAYYGEITVKVLAADGSAADEDFYSIDKVSLKTTNKGVDKDLKGTDYEDSPKTGFKVAEDIDGDRDGYEYTAFAAEAGAYVIEAEVTDKTTGNVLKATNTVNVKELNKDAWKTGVGTAVNVYAPLPYTPNDPDNGIDQNTGLSKEMQENLPWIIGDDNVIALGPTVATGQVYYSKTPTVKESIVSDFLKAADGDAYDAETMEGKHTYYLDDVAIVATGSVIDAVEACLEADPDDPKPITRAAIGKDPADATKVKMGTAETVDPYSLTDPKPTLAGHAGTTAYGLAYTFTDENKGVKASYTIELSDSDKTLGYKKASYKMTGRLAATMGGLFAGYVNSDGSIGTGLDSKGAVVADNTSRIVTKTGLGMGIRVQTYFGKLVIPSTDATTKLYNVGEGVGENHLNAFLNDAAPTPIKETFVTTNLDKAGRVLYTAQKDQVNADVDFAREGTYTLTFTYRMANTKKETKESTAFKVKNDLYVPGVTVKSQTLDSYDQEGWAEAVVSEVDLNNNDSSSWSVLDLVDKNGDTILDDTTPAKWVVVTEEGIDFWKPLDRKFKLS